jgi:hypothetical protein
LSAGEEITQWQLAGRTKSGQLRTLTNALLQTSKYEFMKALDRIRLCNHSQFEMAAG